MGIKVFIDGVAGKLGRQFLINSIVNNSNWDIVGVNDGNLGTSKPGMRLADLLRYDMIEGTELEMPIYEANESVTIDGVYIPTYGYANMEDIHDAIADTGPELILDCTGTRTWQQVHYYRGNNNIVFCLYPLNLDGYTGSNIIPFNYYQTPLYSNFTQGKIYTIASPSNILTVTVMRAVAAATTLPLSVTINNIVPINNSHSFSPSPSLQVGSFNQIYLDNINLYYNAEKIPQQFNLAGQAANIWRNGSLIRAPFANGCILNLLIATANSISTTTRDQIVQTLISGTLPQIGINSIRSNDFLEEMSTNLGKTESVKINLARWKTLDFLSGSGHILSMNFIFNPDRFLIELVSRIHK